MTTSQKKDSLLPIYLINGSDELKRETVLKRLKTRIAERGDISFNSDTFNGETAVGTDIVSACNTVPFASDVRLVQVNNVEKLKKADAEALVEYAASPCVSTVLALDSSGLAKNTRLYKAVAALGKTTVIDCSPQKRYELPKTIRSMAVKHGITLTEGAAHSLVDLVGENTVRLDSELKKIALAHRGNDAVNEHEVGELVGRTAEVKPWEFVDAFAARNQKKCLLYWSRMDSVSPHALLAMCTTRIRELICARALEARGNQGALASELKVPAWRVKNHLAWAHAFSQQELRNALMKARDTERAMKSGADPHEALLSWVLEVTSRK